jgi:hypothetical protein
MKDTNPRIALYKEAILLEERRAVLQAQIDDVILKLSDIKAQLFDAVSPRTVSASTVSSAASTRAGASRGSLSGKRAGRGELKTQVLRALSAAGSAGISVKEITDSIGAKATSVHSWLQSARKQYPIRRISQGRYRLDGNVSVEEPRTKTSRTARPTARKNTRPLGKRGALLASIMSELESAGSSGIKIPDLADKLGVKRKNLFIWFATTGRRNAQIKKIGESHYRLDR